MLGIRAATCATALLLGGALAVSPTGAQAATDLAGTWVSDSLRDNSIGYFLTLRPGRSADRPYIGGLHFERQDGSRNGRVAVRAVSDGYTVTITTRRGSFDRAGRVLVGRLDARRTTLTLTNCTDRLRNVMSWDLDSDCVLRLGS